MIKILHILHGFNMGGLENGVVNLINNTDNVFCHEICCITKTGSAESRLRRNINIYELGKREGHDWRIIPKLVHVINSVKPDIVHTRNWGTVDGVAAGRISGVRTIIHGEHGWNIDDLRGQNYRRLLFRRLLSFGIDHYVAVSEDIRQWMNRLMKVRLGKISKIINGVDTNQFLPKWNQGLKRDLGLKGKLVVGIVGRLDPIKRHDLLFKAFSKLDHNKYKLKLIVIGDGPERLKLTSLKRKLPYPDRIQLLGECNSVHELYNLMDIFVLPSMNEGISNTILEAMSSALPVIATDVGGNPELVTHNKTGFLIRPGSIESIRNAMNYYLEYPESRKRHGENAREKTIRRFSLTRMIKEYKDLYQRRYFVFHEKTKRKCVSQ